MPEFEGIFGIICTSNLEAAAIRAPRCFFLLLESAIVPLYQSSKNAEAPGEFMFEADCRLAPSGRGCWCHISFLFLNRRFRACLSFEQSGSFESSKLLSEVVTCKMNDEKGVERDLSAAIAIGAGSVIDNLGT